MKNIIRKFSLLKFISILSVLSILGFLILSFSPANDKLFKISGKVTDNNGKAIQGVIVSVFWQGSKLSSIATRNTGTYEIEVEYKKNYKVEYSKQGFLTQFFNVSTQVPDDELKGGSLYPFSECNVVLIPQMKGLETKLFDKATNEVKWLDDQGMIEFDLTYQNKIKPSFEQVKQKVVELEKIEYDSKIKKADQEYLTNNLDNALINYYEASNILPKEKLAKAKISEVKKEIAKSSSEEESYLKNLKKGNEYVAQQHFDEAIKYYNNALIYKPEDAIAIQKISDCENSKAKKYLALKNNYDLKIKKADSLFLKNEFEEAGMIYEEALEVISTEQYPKQKLVEIKSKTTVESSYNKYIEKADNYNKNGDSESAIKYYKKALDVKPIESYPKDKIAEIEKAKNDKQLAEAKLAADNLAFNNLIKEADENVKTNKFEEAIVGYKKAGAIKPNESTVETKLKNVENSLAEQKRGQQYFAQISKSNEYLNQKRYTEAKKELEKSKSIDKTKASEWLALCGKAYDESYVPNKISELNKLIDQDKVAIQKSIDAKPIDPVKPVNPTLKSTTPVTQVTPINSSQPTTNSQENVDQPENLAKVPQTKPKQSSEELNKKMTEYLEMLSKYEKSGDKKEVAAMMNNIGNVYLEQKSINKALDFFEKTLEIREQQNDKKGVADVSEDIAVAYYDSGKYESSIDYYQKSLVIREQLGDKKGVVAVMNDLASINENTFRYEKAIDYYQKSLKVSESLGDKETNVKILNKIANVYYENKELDKSIEFYKMTLEKEKELKQDSKAAESLNNIGVLYSDMGDLKNAEKYYSESMTYFDKSNNKMAKSLTLNNLGNINFELKKLNKALDYYEQSLKIKEELKYFIGVATSLHNIGAVHFEMNDMSKAVEYFTKSNKIAIEYNDKKLQSKNYKYLTDVCIKKKDYKGAFECYQNFAKANYVIEGETSKLVNEMFSDLNSLSQENEIENLKSEIQKQKVLSQFEASRNMLQLNLKNLELENANEQISKQKQLIYSFLIGFVIILVFSIMLSKLYIEKKKANNLLTIKNEEILQQKEEIEAQRDEIEVQRDYVVKQRDKIALQKQEITDSIVYAGLIQSAILPPMNYLNQLLSDFFVYFKPRDIVSGDFYWAVKKQGKTIVVVADCTGHGVPGAFMSMLGISSLNEIVNKTDEIDAANILNQLRNHIVDALHQNEENNKSQDGMDISICVFDDKFTHLQTAGAYNPVYVVRNSQLEISADEDLQKYLSTKNDDYELYEIKADKMPVSIYEKMHSFSNNEFELHKGDTIYMFSDGYSDQFGGPDEKKYKVKQFKTLILCMQEKSMNNQREIINNEHIEWKGNNHQIDDMIVVGIKV